MSRRPVITEREVERAAREGKRSLDVRDAVVTPSARDAAKKAGVELQGRGARVEGRAERQGRGSRVEGRAERQGRGSSVEGRAGGTAVERSPSTLDPKPSTLQSPSTLRIALGADHGGLALKNEIAKRLKELGHAVTDLGTNTAEAVDYPDFAAAVARAVAGGHADRGIMVDGAGIGSCMAANKIAGVRAAMCYDLTTATNAREHNDANVLTLGGGLIGPRLALEIVERFLATPFGGGRHAARVDKIRALDPGGD